jgi:F0F1-type ATP synthase assembly protein I
MNKRGGFTDLFIFMIFAFIIVVISAIMIYIGNTTEDQLQETIGKMDLHDTQGQNASVVIDQTFGDVNDSYAALYWISIFLIVGMIVAIFIGSYLVTTKPIFFVPYIFLTIIAIIVSVPISNAYETIANTPDLASTFIGFTGANWIMLYLPVWITIIGFTGGIIMFSRMGKKEGDYYGQYQ